MREEISHNDVQGYITISSVPKKRSLDQNNTVLQLLDKKKMEI
jgi:hypothetical protein